MKKSLTVFLMLFCFNSFCQNKSGTPITIGESITLHSDILNEDRKLNIYLPEGYLKNDNSQYPVVYLLDGGMDEDFLHIAGLFQFASFSWIQWCPPSIIVGIANNDRVRDMIYPTRDSTMKKAYPSEGGSDKFIRFIKDELQPFINAHYKVSGHSSLIGQSLGGLLAATILLKQPELFETYFIVSPSLWWDDGSLLKIETPLSDSSFDHTTHVFIAVGKEGLTPGKHPHVMETDANLLAEKIGKSKSPRVRMVFDYLPDEDHATILHRAILDGLKSLAQYSQSKHK